MNQGKDLAERRGQLIVKHIREQRELSAEATEATRLLVDQHHQERLKLQTTKRHDALEWAALLTKQSERLLSLSTQQSQDRLALLGRQQQELEALTFLS